MAIDISSLGVSVKSDGIKEASSALSGLTTSAKNAEKATGALEQAFAKLNAASKTATGQADAYNQKLQAQTAMLSTLRVDTSATATATMQLAKAMADLSVSLRTVVVNNTAATNSQRTHNEAMREAHALARGLSGSMGALWVTYGNLAGMAVGVALGASLKGIITVGKDVEATLEGLRVKGQETVESVNAIRASVIDLGKGIYGPREVAKAFEVMILAGLNAKQALSGISDALNLATVGGTSIEKAASTVVQVGTALGYTAENYSRIADVIAMTAAVSMSSVESLSEAFKSGSVVGKLYGVTLVDIGTSLAALSNLGIQGSAAGTSLKNFYKELASSSEKVKNTLHDMKLVPADFKDAEGNYLGILQVVGKLSEGLDRLTLAQQKIAIANLSNERGMKTAVELLDLYRKKVEQASKSGEDHTTVLALLQKKIEEAYGFAAIGAAQMALTVDGQFKSVAHTIETVLLEAFNKVVPEISLVATKLKEAFNSPEFANGLANIAVEAAKLAVVIAENIPLIVKLVEAFLAAKAFMFVVELFTAIRTVLMGASVAAAALSLSLGPVAVALVAAGAAYAYFTREKEASSETHKATINYSKDYAAALTKEADRLDAQIALMKEGKKVREAETESMYAQALALAKANGEKDKEEAKDRLRKARAAVTPGLLANGGGLASRAIQEVTAAEQNLAKVNGEVAASYSEVESAIKRTMNSAAEKERLRLAQEKADKAGRTGGTGAITEKAKNANARLNDEYLAEIREFDNSIKLSKKSLLEFEQDINSQMRQGDIGRLQGAEAIARAEVKSSNTIIDALKSELVAAKALPDDLHRTAEIPRITGLIERAEEERNNIITKLRNKTGEELTRIEENTTKAFITELELRGEFVKAAELKYGDLSAASRAASIDLQNNYQEIAKAATDMSAEGVLRLSILIQQHDLLAESAEAAAKRQKAAMDAAQFKQSQGAFDVMFKKLEADIASVDERAAKDGGWFAKFAAQDQIDNFINNVLPALTAAAQKALEDAKKSNNPDAVKAAEEDLKKWNKMLNRKGNAYEDFMHEVDKIGMEGFEALFSNVSGSWLNYTKKMKDTFKNTLVDAIYKMFAKPFILQLVGSFAGLMGMGGLANAANGAASGVAGSAGGSMVGSAAGGLFGAAGSNFMVGVNAAISQPITGFLGGVEAFSTGVGTFATNIGMMMPAIAGLVVVGTILASLFNDGPEEHTFFRLGQNNAPGNISINQRGNEGRTTQSYLGTSGQGAFGTFGVTGTNWMDPTSGKFADKWNQFMTTLGKSDDRINSYLSKTESASVRSTLSSATFTAQTGPEGSDPSAAFPELFKQRMQTILKGIQPGMEALIEGFTGTGDELQAEVETLLNIRKHIGDAAKTFGEPVTLMGLAESLAQFKESGETIGQVITRVGNTFAATNNIATMFGKTQEEVWGVTGVASAKARIELVALAGGLDKFSSQQATFLQNFFTDTERGAMATAQATQTLNDGFGKLGISIPTSVEQYRDLMAAQDLNTESGRATYQTLMDLSTSWTTVNGTAQKAIEDAQKKMSLEEEYATLTNDTNALRAIELQHRAEERATLSPSNQLLFDRNNLLKDEQEVIRKAAEASKKWLSNLETFSQQTDRYTGNTSATRASHVVAANTSMAAVTKAMPWITNFEQLMTMAPEDFKNYSDANKDLILSARSAGITVREDLLSALQTLSDYLEQNFYTSTEQGLRKVASGQAILDSVLGPLGINTHMTHAQFLALLPTLGLTAEGALILSHAFIDVNGTADAASKSLETLSGQMEKIGTFVPFETMIDNAKKYLSEMLDSVGSAFSGTGYANIAAQKLSALNNVLAHLGNSDADRIMKMVADANIAEITRKLARYTILEAQYAGHGEALLKLEEDYAQNRVLLASSGVDVLTALEEKYQHDRLAIINGGTTQSLDALKKWAESLRDWLKGLYLNESLSPLTAQQQLATSRTTYLNDLLKAQGGDETARAALTKDAEAYLNAQKAVTGFGGDYSAVFSKIVDDIEALANAFDPITTAQTFSINSSSFDGVVTAQNGTTNSVDALKAEVIDLKATIARLLEQGNTAVRQQTTAIVGAVSSASDEQTSAITQTAVLTAKA